MKPGGKRGFSAEGPDLAEQLQECFLRRGAAQCGFCTPGMILTALDLVRRSVSQGSVSQGSVSQDSVSQDQARPSRDEIRYALVGNLCRCTGYTKILDAVEEYADQ